MKKIIFFLILLVFICSLKAQTVPTYILSSTVKWIFIAKIPVGIDTVYQARVRDLVLLENPKVEIKSIASYHWTIDIQIIDVDTTFKINIGGSNIVINLNTGLCGFIPFVCDSLPYTISPTKWKKTINGTVQNIKRFYSEINYGSDLPAIQITRLTATPGKKMVITMEFNK